MRDIAADKFENVPDMLASVLCRGVTRLLKKGLDRGYIEHEEIISTIRGKIDVGYTGCHGLDLHGRALCRFDELEYDILHNQILKSTLRLLLKVHDLDREVSRQVSGVYRRLSGISEIHLTTGIFKRVTIHRNNQYYKFLLNICELIVTYSSPDDHDGGYRFLDFMRDEKRMARLFERFVYNFFAKEQSVYSVKSDQLNWPVELGDEGRESDLNYLPAMYTDVTLRSKSRTLVIDTKYYQEALSSKYGGTAKVNSSNLYQINTYLSSLEHYEFPDSTADGVLLYPTNGYHLDLAWKIKGHNVTVKTLDLSKNWQSIHEQLFNIAGISIA